MAAENDVVIGEEGWVNWALKGTPIEHNTHANRWGLKCLSPAN
jgi:hypothetical protein